MSDDEIEFSNLIAAGIVLLIGYGVYRVLKSFGTFEEGDEVSAEELEDVDICSKCGAENPTKCTGCGVCIELECAQSIGGHCHSCYLSYVD